LMFAILKPDENVLAFSRRRARLLTSYFSFCCGFMTITGHMPSSLIFMAE
jgi:hypothetical protein